MQGTDDAARAAWTDRMHAVRHGCEAAVETLRKDSALAPHLTVRAATDILWTMLSVRIWEQLLGECGWSQEQYIATMKQLARAALTDVASQDKKTAAIVSPAAR